MKWSVRRSRATPVPKRVPPRSRPVANNFPWAHVAPTEALPEQEVALQQFIDELHSKDSPNFHHWLTAQEFGERFGLAKPDLDTVAAWLESTASTLTSSIPAACSSISPAPLPKCARPSKPKSLPQCRGEKHVGNISDPAFAALSLRCCRHPSLARLPSSCDAPSA